MNYRDAPTPNPLVYATYDRAVALDMRSGVQVWEFRIPQVKRGREARIHALFRDNGRVGVVSTDHVCCLDASTGQLIATLPIPYPVTVAILSPHGVVLCGWGPSVGKSGCMLIGYDLTVRWTKQEDYGIAAALLGDGVCVHKDD